MLQMCHERAAARKIRRIERVWGSIERCALAAKASAAPQWEKRRALREGQRRVQRTSGAAQCSASSATTHAREAQPAAGWVQRTESSGRAVVRRLSEVGYARRGFAKLQNKQLRGRPGVSPLVLFLRRWEHVKGTDPIRRKGGRGNTALFRVLSRGQQYERRRHARFLGR